MVTPPALRASGTGPSSRHAVSVPSTTRCSRSQVVSGTRRMPASGTSAQSKTTAVHTPDCRTRLSAFSARSIVRSSNVPGPFDRSRAWQPRRIDGPRRFRDRLTTHPQQPREIDPARRRARRIEPIEGVDRARPIRHARWPRPARSTPGSCARKTPDQSALTPARAAIHRQPGIERRPARTARPRRPTPTGSAVVSVRSSLRSRSKRFETG